MTFADLIYKAWTAAASHRTKLAGMATSVVAVFAMYPNIVSARVTDACELGLGILTILCGVANTSSIAAKVAAMQNPTEAQSGPKPESKP